MSKRLVLAGYFGRGNLGDDAILLGFDRAVNGLGYGYVTICGSPEGLMRNYGLKGVGHLDFKAVQSAIEESDALVFPGGSVFQDVTSVRSVAYYANLIKAAKKADKKVVMLGQGIGPLNRFLGKRLAVSAISMVDAIAVRDAESAKDLQRLGVQRPSRVTADMAFLLPEPPGEKEQAKFGVGGMKSIGVSARPSGNDKGKHVVQVFSQLLRLLFDKGWVPAMIEMDREIDRPIIDRIGKSHGGKVPEIKGLTSPVELQKRLMRMDAVIGMRLHAGVLAATVGVPAYMVSYDPKVNAFANAMGLPTPQKIEGTTAERIFDGFQAFMKDRERVVASIRRRRDELSKKAEENIEVLVSTVGK
ncbi:MAG TPA: polysaccharide pyruvyl transferase CsaB [Fimbriimonadaceae bacterium]|nr:polysaccharide pyruvyl transferase CsaB [Fimbriimonadaceae bacterium]